MEANIHLRVPVDRDGSAVHALISRCPPLDINSVYCNLLQCSHFAATSVVALQGAAVVGFISAYRLPERTDTLFIWQVAVAGSVRGRGLASDMLGHILGRSVCIGVGYLETTITADNKASWALFTRLADRLEAKLDGRLLFDRQRHFSGHQASEQLVRIGPFPRYQTAP
ncbi:MAG: diaminobutyrate acetyltransferase [Parahaliea sp.]